MKKIFAIILGLILSITVLGCSTESTTGSETDIIESDQQVLTLQAISSSMLLSYSSGGTEEMAMHESEVLGEEEINDLDYYVEMVEAFLGNDQLDVETQESDLEDYDTMVIYRTYNLQQEEVVYKLYYNAYNLEDEETTTEETTTEETTTEEATSTEDATTEEATTTEAPVTTEPATTEPATTESETTSEEATTEVPEQRRDFMFDDEDDEYAVQGLEGILVVGETTYEIEGKVLEVEGKEILRIRSYMDEDNYVLVNYQKDETEVDKEKFFFQLVEDGQMVSRSRVTVFESEQKQQVQLEFINGENYERYLFQIREDGNETYIHINYRIETEELNDRGNIHLTKTVDEETGEVTYSYRVRPEGKEDRPDFDKPHQPGPFNDLGRHNQSTEM